MKRQLRLVGEPLAELTTDELVRAVGGADTADCNPCTFTWSCDELKRLVTIRIGG